ncbi:hypothetical protein Tco_0868658, partial [Tanacetum coccineum]
NEPRKLTAFFQTLIFQNGLVTACIADARSSGLVQFRYGAGFRPYIDAPNLFLLITYSSSSLLSLSAVLRTSNVAARKV